MNERVVLLIAFAVIVAVAIVVTRAFFARRDAARIGRPLDRALSVDDPGAPTVLYFFGPHCAACSAQRAALAKVREWRERLNVVAVDAARDPDLAAWAGVVTIPSTAIVDPRRGLLAVNHGFKPAEALVAQLAAAAI